MRGKKRTAPNPIDVHVGSRVRMRRLLSMSQEKLADAFRLFSSKCKSTRRVQITSSRARLARRHRTATPIYVNQFVSSPEGLRLIKAFTQISDAGLRLSIVGLVQELAGSDLEEKMQQ
jgi:hypothetical protein